MIMIIKVGPCLRLRKLWTVVFWVKIFNTFSLSHPSTLTSVSFIALQQHQIIYLPISWVDNLLWHVLALDFLNFNDSQGCCHSNISHSQTFLMNWLECLPWLEGQFTLNTKLPLRFSHLSLQVLNRALLILCAEVLKQLSLKHFPSEKVAPLKTQHGNVCRDYPQ